MKRTVFVAVVGVLSVAFVWAAHWAGPVGESKTVAQSDKGLHGSAYHLNEVDAERTAAARKFLEFLRVPDMSVGLYVLGKDDKDLQNPHTEDEIYYIVAGRGVLQIDDHDEPVTAGSVVYVQANAPHHFHSIEEELRILVVFAPAFGSRAAK